MGFSCLLTLSISALSVACMHCLSSVPSTTPMILPPVNTFASTSTHHLGKRRWAKQYRVSASPLNLDHYDSEPETDGCITEEANKGNVIYTTAIIKCAYDGTYFRGWKASNSDSKIDDNEQEKDKENTRTAVHSSQQSEKTRQSRRSRALQRKGGNVGKHGRLRTVEDTIRSALAKLYGDIDANHIIIDGCSRTDAGVHAKSLVAQFWCTKRTSSQSTETMPVRPNSCDDSSNFLPLPFDSDLTKLVFVLNRMLPPDVRVVAASPLPYYKVSHAYPTDAGAYSAAFHPTLHALGKTYTYHFAIGSVHDPLCTQYVWHLDGSSGRAVGMNGKWFSLERALATADLFVDSNDPNMSKDTAEAHDYGAFRSAFRGTDRERVQSTLCKLWECRIVKEERELLPSWETDEGATGAAVDIIEGHVHHSSRFGKTTADSFTVVISGDRFLYKMIRNIVGTIVAVGCGHIELEEVRIALETGKWSAKVRRICAPARGLTLMDVYYPLDRVFDWRTG
jgi:tRNA U38,U39,U40 pseudouridine synthase TruA